MAGLKLGDFRKQRQRKTSEQRTRTHIERRPQLTTQEERFLYGLHLKTIECRTLMATLKATMAPSQYNEFIVDYSMRLRKAKKNFEDNNWKDEWFLTNEELTTTGNEGN